jgi:transcriptional regulator with GAF, ATPase, and Fis domain
VDIELRLWRAACSHTELPDCFDRMAELLKERVPLGGALLRRLDPAHRRLETTASTRGDRDSPSTTTRTELAGDRFDVFATWCVEGTILRRGPEAPRPPWELLLPPREGRAALALPLAGSGSPLGVLVLLARAGQAFGDTDERVAAALRAPFATLLEKDRVHHEVSRLREAAAGDRRALSLPQDISESIVGSETGLRPVMQRLELVASTDTPVLVLGETGSGKEVVARAIHARSPRRNGPILRVNCGAIPPELVDSELFGHERGSFTGAVGTRKGWFERADGGTLFLDEIGELPLAAQVRLLRILQDGSLERVGGQHTLTVDVRLVAATHRDLPEMVAERRFRPDLWYRINVFPIVLPPLRERREDIPALAAHFARRAGSRLGAGPLLPSQQDLDLLLAYEWPGNVRELAAVIERAAILGNARCLEVAAALGGPAPGPPPGPLPARIEPRADAPFPTLETAMARHIEHALRRCRGRIEGPDGAAALLAINPHTLRARMRKLGITWARFRDGPGHGADVPTPESR